MKYLGFDTETLEGYARVIATNEEYIPVSNFSDILDFLNLKKHRGVIFWTWNLRYDTQAILKHLLKENELEWRDISRALLEDGYTLIKNKRVIKIRYIQGKKLTIVCNNRVVKFYDIAQFYGKVKLNTAAKDYLKKEKQDYANWVERSQEYQKGEHTLKEMQDYLFHNLDDIGEYCRIDAELTLELANYMKNAFEFAGIPFNKPMSQAKIAEDFVLSRGNYPIQPELLGKKMSKYHELAELSYHGGIFETVQRGIFDQEIFDYDINSAYPKTLSRLPHWANGEFKQVETYTDGIEQGWYLVEFDCRWIPFVDTKNTFTIEQYFNEEAESYKYEGANPRILYPTGKRVQVITRIELNFMLKYNYKVKVYGGVEWEQTKNKYESPFSWVAPTYAERQKIIKEYTKADMRQYALKILLNSTYGKTAMRKPFRCDMTNLFYASYVTADTRIKIAEVAQNNYKNVIDLATDGICLSKEVKGIEVDDSKLGAWELKTFKKALFIGSGIRQMFLTEPNKKGQTYETYARGLTEDRQYNLLEAIEQNKHTNLIYNTKTRPLNLGECVQHTKTKTIDNLNIFTEVTKKLDVNTDKKHNWSKIYDNYDEFLQVKTQGEPFTLKQLGFTQND